MPDRSNVDRALIARIAAHTRWSQVADRAAATAPGRRAALERFEKIVDPAGILDPTERAKRAASARSAHFARMALKSAQARRGRRTRATSAEVEAFGRTA